MSLSLPENINNQLIAGRRLSQREYRGRFAPSPSGPMHLGNLRTALFSWLRARALSGVWLLRIDDLDLSRNRLGAIESIEKDLLWLGLPWDGPVILQSKRIQLYKEILSSLKLQQKLYACICSRNKLLCDLNLSKNNNFIYPGTCRNLHIPWEGVQGKLVSWRLKVNQKYSISIGDPIVKRADGFIAYHLATVVDELTLGINEVVRGEDLKNSMYTQIAITESLNQLPIKYFHLPIMLDKEGKKLSKRNFSEGLKVLQANGMKAEQVIGLLASSFGLVPENTSLSSLELLDLLLETKSKSLILKDLVNK